MFGKSHKQGTCDWLPMWYLNYKDNIWMEMITKIVIWWREHQQEYPWLSRLACCYLCITPTFVPCERAFSKGGWIVNKCHSSLSDDHISSLLFISFNSHPLQASLFHHLQSPSFTPFLPFTSITTSLTMFAAFQDFNLFTKLKWVNKEFSKKTNE